MQSVEYEWDNRKAAANLHKHGVDFADAIAALEDANRVEEIDTRCPYEEERVQVIGMAHGRVLFVVVTLPDEDTSRIISARKATRHEQNRYYSSNPESW
ncbi:MAG: BrnT family toxin [Methylobacteriaceae bacterium]|nr:BrnT family toxin [Methylobacteriaceae bacterium]MBV9245676.1 BrnT family toxin [Methylobacteriaceae bacterium]